MPTSSDSSPLTGLAPVIAPDTRILILGSFPGAASLAAQQYYAHPRNQFWKLVGTLIGEDLYSLPYEDRLPRLLAHRFGLWDVLAACEREGSLDSAIRKAEPNDIAGLALPRLAAIVHNGAESFKHARHTQGLGVPVYRLPSSSAANASWTFARKRDAWREVFLKHGLV